MFGVTTWARSSVAVQLVCTSALGCAAPAAADPTPDEQKLYGLLSKGYTPQDCHLLAPAGNQTASLSCDVNADPGGPFGSTYALYRDPGALQAAFFAAIGDSTLVPCPGVNQSPTVWHLQGAPDQTAGSIACSDNGHLSEVLWTKNSDLLLGRVDSVDEIPRLYQWWLQEG